jgi:hypothetical protein
MNLDSKYPYAIAEYAVKTLREGKVDPTIRFELESNLLSIAKFAQDTVNRQMQSIDSVKKSPLKKAASSKVGGKKRHKTATQQQAKPTQQAAPQAQAPKRRGRPPKVQQAEMFAS